MDINTGNHFTIQGVLFASKEDFKVWFAVENVALASNMGRKHLLNLTYIMWFALKSLAPRSGRC